MRINQCHDEIRFDMSRDGLLELSNILEPLFDRSTDEMKNFTNQIRNLAQRVPTAKESSWLDE